MKTVRFVIPALLVAVLAACSVPISSEDVDLDLGLESQRIVVRRSPATTDLTPAQAIMYNYEGTISVTANKVEDRLTIRSLEIPIDLDGSVVVDPEGALDGQSSFTLQDFTISFAVSDGASSVEIGTIELPVSVTIAPGEGANWTLTASDTYTLFVLATAMNQVNDIITGDTSETFTFTATIGFKADLPDELQSLSFTIEDGKASVKGSAKLL